jgi:hypothetical protein
MIAFILLIKGNLLSVKFITAMDLMLNLSILPNHIKLKWFSFSRIVKPKINPIFFEVLKYCTVFLTNFGTAKRNLFKTNPSKIVLRKLTPFNKYINTWISII